MKKGRLYLLPSPLGENDPAEVIPVHAFGQIRHVRHFVVEEIRTARRYLSKIGFRGRIDQLSFYELNEHTHRESVEEYLSLLTEGNDVVLISEAGLPAVADPGAALVELAHTRDIEILPFVGPSSLMLALMSSGLNGQNFAFNGYIPVKANERRSAIRELEKRSESYRQTQLLIETPYRNDSLFKDILSVCHPETRLCVAADITLPTQLIKTRTIAEWSAHPVEIGKRPCVFLLLSR